MTATAGVIDTQQRELVVAATDDWVRRAALFFGREFAPVGVRFDLRGRAAGMYRVLGEERHIRYNPYIFAKFFDDNLSNTVPHEVAHYITDCVYGLRNIRPHGNEWRSVMAKFGIPAQRTCNYDLTGIPVRRQRRFDYRCQCMVYDLTTRRHNKVLRGQARYKCKHCGAELRHAANG